MKHPIFFLVATALTLFSCAKKELSSQEASQKSQSESAQARAIKEFVSSLDDHVKISQLFLVNIEGSEKYRAVEKTADGSPLVPGGCLLFSYNIASSPEKIATFTESIKSYYIENKNIPPYIAVDQEGGDVNRLRKITSTLPSQKWVSENFSLAKAKSLYALQASQLRLLGINMNLAPVVEAENERNAHFLGTRTFGSADNVVSYAGEEIAGYEENGIATVLKHFPGNSDADPHSNLPEIRTTKEELERDYIQPFRTLLPKSSAVLMSHARVTVSDDEAFSAEKKVPACLSPFWVTGIVRNELGFGGLILSDDIFMAALSENGFPPEKACIQALEAGIDVIMLSEKKFGMVAELLLEKAKSSESFNELVEKAVCRVIQYKINAGLLSVMSEKTESGETRSRIVVNENRPAYDKEAFSAAYTQGMELYK
ncbi:MAG: glycoside hydrolase family 3 protein [Treponema sp.]|nr:glycoside hydrolase family 3 protein [Treponema sp.]